MARRVHLGVQYQMGRKGPIFTVLSYTPQTTTYQIDGEDRPRSLYTARFERAVLAKSRIISGSVEDVNGSILQADDVVETRHGERGVVRGIAGNLVEVESKLGVTEYPARHVRLTHRGPFLVNGDRVVLSAVADPAGEYHTEAGAAIPGTVLGVYGAGMAHVHFDNDERMGSGPISVSVANLSKLGDDRKKTDEEKDREYDPRSDYTYEEDDPFQQYRFRDEDEDIPTGIQPTEGERVEAESGGSAISQPTTFDEPGGGDYESNDMHRAVQWQAQRDTQD